MGEKMVREVLEYAKSPDALTAAERMWLVKEVAGGSDETRKVNDVWPGEMGLHLSLSPELVQMVAKGALEIREDGVYLTDLGPTCAAKARQILSLGRIEIEHDGAIYAVELDTGAVTVHGGS